MASNNHYISHVSTAADDAAGSLRLGGGGNNDDPFNPHEIDDLIVQTLLGDPGTEAGVFVNAPSSTDGQVCLIEGKQSEKKAASTIDVQGAAPWQGSDLQLHLEHSSPHYASQAMNVNGNSYSKIVTPELTARLSEQDVTFLQLPPGVAWLQPRAAFDDVVGFDAPRPPKLLDTGESSIEHAVHDSFRRHSTDASVFGSETEGLVFPTTGVHTEAPPRHALVNGFPVSDFQSLCHDQGRGLDLYTAHHGVERSINQAAHGLEGTQRFPSLGDEPSLQYAKKTGVEPATSPSEVADGKCPQAQPTVEPPRQSSGEKNDEQKAVVRIGKGSTTYNLPGNIQYRNEIMGMAPNYKKECSRNKRRKMAHAFIGKYSFQKVDSSGQLVSVSDEQELLKKVQGNLRHPPKSIEDD